MDWYVFLILLLLSLPPLKLYGDSRWSWAIAVAWSLGLAATNLDFRVTSFYLSPMVWCLTIILLIGFRYRRWAGLGRERRAFDWAVLFTLYAASVGVFSLLIPTPGYLADYSNEHNLAYGLLGAIIVGLIPLLAFWGYSRLVGHARDKTPGIAE